MKKGKLIKNLILVSLIVVVSVLLMTVIDKSSDRMAESYYNLTNKPDRSNQQFNIPAGQISSQIDGTTDINYTVVTDEEDIEVDVDEKVETEEE